MVQSLSDANFSDFIANNNVALIDFTATWCGPCQMLKPIVEKLATKYEGKAGVAAVDIDESRETATNFQITSVPTVILFKNGEVAEQIIGLKSQADFERILDNLIG